MGQNIKLFAYLNIEHPMVAWEVAIGRLKSVCDNNDENFGVSLWQYNLLKKYAMEGLNKKFLNELRLEKIRQAHFPDRVSRLKGLYFFRNEQDARIALDRWRIPNRKKYISEVYFSATSITELDSEWITFNLLSKSVDWMHDYWAGSTYGEYPLTELLVSGIGVVQDRELRKQAYQRILHLFPTSSWLLAAACCAFKHCEMEEIAQVRPALLRTDGTVQGGYFIDMRELDNNQKEVADAVKKCAGLGEVPPVIAPPDKDIKFRLPDFTGEKFNIKDSQVSGIYEQIHKV